MSEQARQARRVARFEVAGGLDIGEESECPPHCGLTVCVVVQLRELKAKQDVGIRAVPGVIVTYLICRYLRQ